MKRLTPLIQIKAPYLGRRQVEIPLLDMKSTMGMEIPHYKSSEKTLKEIWMNLIG